MMRIVAAVVFAFAALPAHAALAPKASIAEPALQQCIEGIIAQRGSGEDSGSSTALLTDCIGVGTNACQNDVGDVSAKVLVACDENERAFWAMLAGYALGELRTSLRGAGLAGLEHEEAAWPPWLKARCDFVRLSIADPEQSQLESSWCVMETTGEHAIDLVLALPGLS
ncbi:MAG: hypothetical protein ABI697_04535 [Devosia sp.]